MRLILSIAFILCCTALASLAQSHAYKFSHIDVNKGLSHNQISSFFKDSRGFVWVGTGSGLNRYNGHAMRIYRHDVRDTTTLSNSEISRISEDPHGRIWINESDVYDYAHDRFSRNTSHYLAAYGIANGTLHDIVKESNSRWWFLHGSQGLYLYENGKPTRRFANDPADTTSIATNRVSALANDGQHLWIIHYNGILEKMDSRTGRVTLRNNLLARRHDNAVLGYEFTIDTEGKLWIFSSNSANGLFVYNPSNNKFQFINTSSPGLKLNTNIVRGIVEDNKGIIWVATDHGGINLINQKTNSVQYVLHQPEDDKSISQNSITTLYKDQEGIIWVGTYKKGANYYHDNIIRFPVYKHYMTDPTSLMYDDVNRFVEDGLGNLWIGTNGGGLIYFDRTTEKFTQYKHNPSDPGSLSNDVIVSLCMDRKGRLWIGTYFGGLNVFDGKKFRRYRHNPTDTRSIGDDNIWEIYEDSQGNIWIGTLYRGLDLYDEPSDSFRHYRGGSINSIKSNYVSAILEDKDGNLWVGTDYGLNVLEKESGRFISYVNDAANNGSLSNNMVMSILQDSHDRIWIGTREGLNQYHPESRNFSVTREEDGLPHNTVLTALEDDHGNLWLGTPNGLTNMIFNADSTAQALWSFKTYDESDGLQGRQFNENAAYKSRAGELIFGGPFGFNVFRPNDLGINTRKPKVVFTDLQIFNKSVDIGEEVNGRVVLSRAISETNKVVLKHSDNVLSIEFAALNYFHPEKNSYLYKLEGFDEDWTSAAGKAGKVTYTNLDPGSYTLRVKAANNDGIWNDVGSSLQIEVLPPFWRTPWAFLLYVVVIVGALLLSRKILVDRERMKFRLAQQQQEARQMHALDMMKIRFFTNVSHEFKTPLTLILTPLEKMLKTAGDTERDQLSLIQRNARRLLNLVNKLLDLRKLEVDDVQFNPSEGDIVAFIRDTVSSFTNVSENRDIALSFRSSITSLETIFDQDKLEKILFNLLSNAFKFTPKDGSVVVELKRFMKESSDKWIEISVSDTGIGIAEENRARIFDRFFQAALPKSMVNQGSGIGLSITREFVKIHGGDIVVESHAGQGSTFRVRLPVREVTVTLPDDFAQQVITGDVPIVDVPTLPQLLLVEDNDDFRTYLRDNLKQTYRILEARDGAEGWSKTLSALPDLIVSDLMMPNMNGIEFCQKVKSDSRVSHIPVILLTARTSEEDKMEGFEGGADDYITKPFSFELLQARIKNLIHQRELFQKDFRRLIEVRASDVKITPLDETLIRKAIECVEQNIAEADFTVEDLSYEMGMSRVHLYKKLMALTGKAPLEFIRSIRLQRAAQLLEKSQLSVSEVAYKVGFNNPKYFAKYFKEEYGVLPSAYQASKQA